MDDVAALFISSNQTTINLAIALLLGAIIGLERGWDAREQKSGERIAGIRTFALIGLLGGISAVLALEITVWAFPVMLVSVAAIGLVAYSERLEHIRNFSITGMVGMLLTFCFGAIAVAIDPVMATAAAVITAIILDNKEEIHGWVQKLQAHELDAALKLLLISVVMLPLLPNTTMGPGGVLNPREIWWMVVLIASISFVGYFAIRVAGARKGILFTSLFAGLSSSTALTLHFSRQASKNPDFNPQFAAGILIACGTMFPRILMYCLIINTALLPSLIWPVAVMTVLLYGPALFIWKRHSRQFQVSQPNLSQNPLDLSSALVFGLLLTAILILGEFLKNSFGDAGIYALAATSGVADVDAITLSLTRMSNDGLGMNTAVLGIVIAAAVNNLVKSGMAWTIGNRRTGLLVAGPMVLSLAAGLLIAWLQ
ncbi:MULTISPECIES: MgtC/SapB family protein [unclassified Marinobacter]|uniref:Membrane protein n=1 Tax=Marinobacter nauticus TaxID=2743 RepID=A0A455W2C6_MARNT|nr:MULTISPECIES: MgtC/SapB family protein [unclassified Marinobacter]QFS86316.1 MgtC family protein [Marinobacter sp. THAF197a]QFT50097.1 MgtC family protein [Marinobacter sp. THAF39]BBJ03319.1 membrane protein [Marinobacter nauticus]